MSDHPTAEREQLSKVIAQNLNLDWGAHNMSDDLTDDDPCPGCLKLADAILAAGYAKPSLLPDGGDDVLRPGGAWTPSDVPEQVLKDAKACLSSLLARPKERAKTNHVLRVLIANITRRFAALAGAPGVVSRPMAWREDKAVREIRQRIDVYFSVESHADKGEGAFMLLGELCDTVFHCGCRRGEFLAATRPPEGRPNAE